MKSTSLSLILLLILSPILAQNTVGIQLNDENSLNGLTLFSPRTTITPRYTYLIDNCGKIVNQWDSEFPLFSTDYLMEDGSLYRSVVNNFSTLDIPGNTGRIEHLTWEGNTIWFANISDIDYSFHHDYVVLENGNILLLVAFRKTMDEAIQNGRDPSTIATGELYEEAVWEIEPTTAGNYNLIWEWRSWDHLIQDFDNTKDNFGGISQNPQKVNINFGISFGEADWWHSNALSYSPDRDHIIISNRNLDEFIIIDHSTTTEEAASSSGGNSNAGGDILFRYGNPASYNQGSSDDKTLDAMHDVQFIPSGSPNAGNIMIFNNQPEQGYSEVIIINPEYDPITFTYAYDGGAFTAGNIEFTYSDTDNFFAPFLSGSQELPNGNILITNGPSGELFEITSEEEIVWKYQSPVSASVILSDNENSNEFQTRVFRSLKYPLDYAAFTDRDLTPGNRIELDPEDDGCSTLSISDDFITTRTTIYPNPSRNMINIRSNNDFRRISIFSLTGEYMSSHNANSINISNLDTGVYILKITHRDNTMTLKQFIKK